MSIQRAVITAAAPDQKSLPLQTLVDQRGRPRSALSLILDECVDAGAEEICVIVCPGAADMFARSAGQHANRLTFIEQDNPQGYGDALFRAKEFVGEESFLHLISDHVYISHGPTGCAKQLVDLALEQNCTVSAVQETRENRLPYFGVIGGVRDGNRDDTYLVNTVLEKPTPTRAEQDLIVAGLRASHYLCFSGMHVLTSGVMESLEESINSSDEPVSLSEALHATAQRERYLALRVKASRYNIGEKYGLLKSQLALALSGKDRDIILSELLSLVASTRGEN